MISYDDCYENLKRPKTSTVYRVTVLVKLESRCFSMKHAGAPSIGLYFAEKIMSDFEQIF